MQLQEAEVGEPKAGFQWMPNAIFGLVCVLVIGMYAWFAEPGSTLALKSPRAEDSYYNLLVQGFRAGQLNLKVEAPPGLAQLADPYDPAVNTPYTRQVYDMSYYKGKLYLYFGITPALVLFWPYLTLTGHYLSDKNAVICFWGLGFLAAAGLIRAIWRRYFPEAGVWVTAVGVVLLGLAMGMQKVSTLWCNVYEVAMVSGFAFTMLSLAAIWRAFCEPRRAVCWMTLASLAYGLAVGSRPSLLFGVIILLVPVAQAWGAATKPDSRRRGALLLAAAVVPAMLIGAGLMLYNALRFDNPFEFGWHYQLNGDYRPTTAQQFSLHYFWFNCRFYFLEPMRWTGRFPFLQAFPAPPLPPGYDGIADSFGGLLSNCPVVWLALAAPLAWRGRSSEAVSILRWFVTVVFFLFGICASTLCVFFAAGSRYELDFLPALILLVVIGILGLERSVAASPVWRRIVRGSWCLLAAYSVLFNLLASAEAHTEANCFAGNALLNEGREDEAIIQFQKALALWPESADAHAGLGSVYYQQKSWDKAIVEFQKALDIKPDLASAHNNLGYCLLYKGRVNEAITEFEKTLGLKPAFTETHNTLGDCFFQQGRLSEAILQYQKALEIKPDFVEARNNLGYSLFQLGRVNEAITEFQSALELNPDFAEAENNLGFSLFQIGRVDEAILHYRKAIQLRPGFAQAYDDLGSALRRNGKAAEAVASYQRAIELDPQIIPARIKLAWMLATWPQPSVRNGDKAIALAEQANQISGGKDPGVLRTLAAAYAETGRFSEAILTAKQALALASAQSRTALINELRTEIGLYQTNTPCRSVNNF